MVDLAVEFGATQRVFASAEVDGGREDGGESEAGQRAAGEQEGDDSGDGQQNGKPGERRVGGVLEEVTDGLQEAGCVERTKSMCG